MTITTLETRNEYTATAGQTIFNYTFKIFASTDLNVYQTPAGRNEADDSLDLITGYSVSGVGDEDGGAITLNTGASVGDLITIVSNIPDSREINYQNNGDFKPEIVNNDFDRVVSIAKQAIDKANRGLQLSESQQGVKPFSLPKPVANSFMKWNATLDGLENVLIGTANLNLPVLQLSNYADTAAAIAAIGSIRVELWIDVSETLQATTTFNVNTKVVFLNGFAYSDDANNADLTFNGEIIAAMDQQIFNWGNGTGKVSLAGANDKVSVKWFGAKGDMAISGGSWTSGTDDTSSIKHAIRSCFLGNGGVREELQPNSTLYFPSGNYRVTETGLFSDTGVGYQIGWKIEGVNENSSWVILDSTVTPVKWLYDNSGATISSLEVKNIAFGTTDGTWSSGFKFNANGNESNMHFENVRFEDLLNAVHITERNNLPGSGTGYVFINVVFKNMEGPIIIQANLFNEHTTFYACEFYGKHDVFDIQEGGGGFSVFGGVIVGGTSGAKKAIVHLSSAEDVTLYSANYSFYGVHIEAGAADQDYLVWDEAEDSGAPIEVVFNACNLYGWWNGAADDGSKTVSIKENDRVIFRDCILPRDGYEIYELYQYNAGWPTGESNAYLEFNSCRVTSNLWDQILLTTDHATIKAQNCININHSNNPTSSMALDGDVGWNETNASSDGSGFKLKSFSIIGRDNIWPKTAGAGTEFTFKLPPTARIKNIYIYKPADGAQSEGYQLHVGNNDKSTTYLSSHTQSIRNGEYRWTVSGSGTNEYYVELAAGGNPSLGSGITANRQMPTENNVVMPKGTMGSLAAGQADYGDNDSLGWGTYYVRLTSGAPDPDNHPFDWIQLPGRQLDIAIGKLELSPENYINVGATDNERIVRLWSTGGDALNGPGALDGYVIVEYY